MVKGGCQIPNIAWGKEVPAGTYTIGGDKDAIRGFEEKQVQIEQPYQLARYPITYAQFNCFMTATDVLDSRWWQSMPAEAQEWRKQAFKFWNHPREQVSWYQAVAFAAG